MSNKKRLGKFKLSSKCIESDYELVKKLMGNMVIVRAEYMYAYDIIEYHAISDLFEPINADIMLPYEYEFIFKEEEIECRKLS